MVMVSLVLACRSCWTNSWVASGLRCHDTILIWRHCNGYDIWGIILRADSKLAPSQWETSLQSNTVSHWLGANLESALILWLKNGRSCYLLLHDVLNDRLVLLTLNMLSCFEDYKKCIHILYHIYGFIQQKETKFTMEQPYLLPILHC